MKDSRFVSAPEDFEDLAVERQKGKGSQAEKKVKTAARNKRRSRQQKSGKQKEEKEQDEEEEGDLYDQVLNGPLPSTSKIEDSSAEEGSKQEDDDDSNDSQLGDEDDEDINEPLNLAPKPLQLDQLASYNSKVDMTGIIYLSRIPPGMGPAKVKHILSTYGDVGRIYLVAAANSKTSSSNSHSSSSSSKRAMKERHRPHRFTEGWVEFLDKRVARNTAELLNANTIGMVGATKSSKSSKKNGGTKKWKDDVWTMKYLPRFKWNMLSEQVAVEAATRAALLRQQLSQSKREQAEYLSQVERAGNYEKAQLKKRAREDRKAASSTAAPGEKEDEDGTKPVAKKQKRERNFEQRTSLSSKSRKSTGEGTAPIQGKLGSVLDSLF